MASITVKVSEIKLDRLQRPFVNAQDVSTNQYVTVYAKKGMDNILDPKLVGKTVTFEGTVHAFVDRKAIMEAAANGTLASFLRDYSPNNKLVARSAVVGK